MIVNIIHCLEFSSIIIPILQLRKLRHRVMTWLAQIFSDREPGVGPKCLLASQSPPSPYLSCHAASTISEKDPFSFQVPQEHLLVPNISSDGIREKMVSVNTPVSQRNTHGLSPTDLYRKHASLKDFSILILIDLLLEAAKKETQQQNILQTTNLSLSFSLHLS